MTRNFTYVTEVIMTPVTVTGILKESEWVEEETGRFPLPLDNPYHPALLIPADLA
jgi:hypothetical protein